MDRKVPCGRGSTIDLMYYLDGGESLAQTITQLTTSVRTAIVHQHYLFGRLRLSQEGLYALDEVGGRVVNGYQK